MINTTKAGSTTAGSTTSLSWREAQAWLAGYSDGLDGTESVREYWSDYDEHYLRGHAVGAERAELRAA